uniref:Uncharacterized protein n=1 Tax=Panagrolaimus sp. PS1159 TaxID=55785 RepID=A0AC35FCI2_9BILA
NFQTSYCGAYDASCKPFIYGKRITIIVEEINCPTFIKNAKIYYPPTTSTTSLPSTKSVAPSETSEGSNEWYIWVIFGVAFVLLIGIIIAIFVSEDVPELKLDPKPETKPKTPAEEIAPPPKAAKKSKKKTKKSKKEKKQKTPVKKDTVDDLIPLEAHVVYAADVVTPSMEPDSVVPPPPPPPPPPQIKSSGHPLKCLTPEQVLDEDYYSPKVIRWIKSRSSKSGASNRKSIDPPPIIIKNVIMKLEPHYASLQRWKKSALEESEWKEFEHKESQATLKEKGAEFRRNGKAAKKFPASVYQYLEDSKTPEYIRYTAMGSEIG